MSMNKGRDISLDSFMGFEYPEITDVKQLEVIPCKISSIQTFVERWHYSKDASNLTPLYCFKLVCEFIRETYPDIETGN